MSETKEKYSDFTGVRAKLEAHRKENEGTREAVLPHSGITVQIPKFISHGAWMKAQRQAKGDVGKAQTAFIMNTVTFEGERLVMADVHSGLIDGRDMLFLSGEVFGDDKDDASTEDDAGNDRQAAN